MRTHIRTRDIVVTSTYVEVVHPIRIRYWIHELRDPFVVQHPCGASKRVWRGLSALAPVVVLPILPHLHSGFEVLMGLLAAMAPSMINGGCLRTGPVLEIRAWCGIGDVVLFQTVDPMAFGQVRRALVRAFENAVVVRPGVPAPAWSDR